MPQSRLYQTRAIILARRDQGEADRVILCLTPEMRLDLLARGVRKPRSRKAGHVELFAETQLLIARSRHGWDNISQAEIVHARALLRDDFLRATYARYMAELVLRFFEGETEPALYALLNEALTLLESDPLPERVARWYEQQLLVLAGFRPEWHTCVGERGGAQCGVSLHPRPQDRQGYGIGPERGGALCPACYVALRDEAGVRPLSPSALSWLQGLQRLPYAQLTDLNLRAATARELAQVMEHYIAYHLERRPATLRMVD